MNKVILFVTRKFKLNAFYVNICNICKHGQMISKRIFVNCRKTSDGLRKGETQTPLTRAIGR